MALNEDGHETVYLGDGAYVAFDGFGFNVYTDRDGVKHWVQLDPPALQALVTFAQTLGMKFKVPL